MRTLAFIGALLALVASTSRAGNDGIRIGNWPPIMPVSGTVSVTNVPAILATLTATVAISTASVMVAAANANRRGLLLFNNSTTTVYIAYDATASMTHFTFPILSQTTWTMPIPIYQGSIAAVRAATGDGKLLVTELL